MKAKHMAPALSMTVAVFAACSTPGARPASYGLKDYYPLGKGFAWSYQVTTFETGAQGQKALTAVRVADERGGEYSMAQGDKTFSYTMDENGLMKTRSRAYILRKPLEKGASWDVDIGGMKGRAAITAAGLPVKALGRTYENCVVVEEVFKDVARLVSSYCPGYGLTLLEEFHYTGGRETMISRIELIAFAREPAQE